jgi:DNA invertase Pin-like site-specific DNA recombinase
LVAFTFLKTPENPKRFVVKQKDGIPSHNNPLNLKWVHYYEWQDNNYKRQGIRNPASKFEQQDLFVIKQLLSTGNFTTSEIAEKYNVSRGAIENILNNKSYNQGVKPC